MTRWDTLYLKDVFDQPDEEGGTGADVQLRLPERGRREAHRPEGVLLYVARGRGRALLHAQLRQRLGRGR